MLPDGIDTSALQYLHDEDAASMRNYRIFKEDIYISVAGTIGIVGRVPEDLDGANLSDNADRIANISCDANYLMYSLKSEYIQSEIDSIRTIGAQPKLALGAVSHFNIMLPDSRVEQASIAEALLDADRLIAQTTAFIAKKQAMKQGIMQQLLTGRTRLPGSATPWTKTTLGNSGAFLKGRGIKRDDVRASGIPCIRYGELYTEFENYTDRAVSFVRPEVAATALPLETGDLLFSGSGETRDEIGKCVAYVGDEPAVAGGDLIILRGTGFNPIYLALLANTPSVVIQKSRAGQGDAVVHISSKALARIQVDLPPQDEQDAIVSVVLDINHEIDALRRSLAKARDVKQGMMQQLLTGRIRLAVQD